MRSLVALAITIVVLAGCTRSETVATTVSADVLSQARTERDGLRAEVDALRMEVARLEQDVARYQTSETSGDLVQASLLRRITALEADLETAEERARETAERADILGYRYEPASYGWAHAPVRSCGSSVSGVLSSRDKDVTVGPLTLFNMLEYPDLPDQDFERNGDGFTAQKVLALVEGTARVLLVVPESHRTVLGLLYDRTIWQPEHIYEISESGRAVILQGCAGRVATQFNGGFVVAGPRCVELDVFVDGSLESNVARFSFGSGVCP